MSLKPRQMTKRSVISDSGITASAQLVDDLSRSFIIQRTSVQAEAWNYYKNMGELHFAIHDWYGNSMSRVRIRAAIAYPGQDPQIIINNKDADTEAVAVSNLVEELGGGIGGQAALMRKLAVQLAVPGESYLVGEEVDGQRVWSVRSNSELRKSGTYVKATSNGKTSIHNRYDVMGDVKNEWRTLGPDTLVARIWQEDDEYACEASSAVIAALPILKEIDFYNRYIVAILLSRLASNGILLIPDEVQLPSKPQHKNAPDPFIADLVDIASKAIQNPGSAAAAVPIPIRVPSQYIESFRHMTFSTEMGDKVYEDRERAIKRLATSINIPTEILTGMSDINHWGQWQMEESAIKIYISPGAETICNGLSLGFLGPMLAANKVPEVRSDGGRYVMWYDTSELSQVPDRTVPAQEMFDRGELKGSTLRDASGFDPEDDAPDDKEIRDIVLRRIAMSANADSLTALALLLNDVPNDEMLDIISKVKNPNDMQHPGIDTDVEPVDPSLVSKTTAKEPPGTRPDTVKKDSGKGMRSKAPANVRQLES